MKKTINSIEEIISFIKKTINSIEKTISFIKKMKNSIEETISLIEKTDFFIEKSISVIARPIFSIKIMKTKKVIQILLPRLYIIIVYLGDEKIGGYKVSLVCR